MCKLKSNSTLTIKGLLFQFLVALEKCFDMQQGESVYIETYGDVSVLGDLPNSKQIESKFYKKALTDLDKNIWKSIYNWMSTGFPIDRFSSLVLLTTQKVSSGSAWVNWNSKIPEERMTTLINIKKSFEARKRKDKKLATYINVIFDAKNATRLSHIVKILYLDEVSMDGKQYHKYLREKYGKNIPDINKGKYIDQMYGYILNPKIVNKNWEITYEDFNREAQEVAKTLVDSTIIFPTKLNLTEIHADKYEKNIFVEKIKEIQYDKVIPEAIDDYVHTADIIQQELEMSEIKMNSLLTYEENIMKNYNAKYRKASRCCTSDEQIAKSQDFYDDITSSNDGTFHNYNNVPTYFHNGVLHILANEKPEFVWLLKNRSNE